MMNNRVLMARFDPKSLMLKGHPGYCGCAQQFDEGETVLLYPNPEYESDNVRDMVCMTCHFWFVHEVLNELDR